jgi:hypothetical protein
MRQRGGQFAFKLVFGFFDFTQQLFVFHQQHIRVVGFFFRRVGVFEVEVEYWPVYTVARRLCITRLQAQRFYLGAQVGNLGVDLFEVGGIGGADQAPDFGWRLRRSVPGGVGLCHR